MRFFGFGEFFPGTPIAKERGPDVSCHPNFPNVTSVGKILKRSGIAMKSMLSVLAFGLLIALTVPGMSEAADLGLITGTERGTYYQFGLNPQPLVKPHGIDLAVHTSRGSVENIY